MLSERCHTLSHQKNISEEVMKSTVGEMVHRCKNGSVQNEALLRQKIYSQNLDSAPPLEM